MTDISYHRALGVKGFLIRTLDNSSIFRVYDHEHNFVDYDITNHDCEIIIVDPDAALVHTSVGNFLDYTAESLSGAKNQDE